MFGGGRKINGVTGGGCDSHYQTCLGSDEQRELAEIFKGLHRMQVENEEMGLFLKNFPPFRDTMSLALIRAGDPKPKDIERLRREFGILGEVEFYFRLKREMLKYFLDGSHLAADSIDAEYVKNAAKLIFSFRRGCAPPLAALDERIFADDFLPRDYAELQGEAARRIAILEHPAVLSHIRRMQRVVKNATTDSISQEIRVFSDNRDVIQNGFRDWQFMARIPGRESELADIAPPPELYDEAVAELKKIQKILQGNPAEAQRRFTEFRTSPIHRRLEHFLAGYHGLKSIRTKYIPKLAITASAGFASGLATLSLSALYPALEATIVGQTGLALAGGGAFLAAERPLAALVLGDEILPGADAMEKTENAAVDLVMMSAMLRVLHGSMRLVGWATQGLAKFGAPGEFARLSTNLLGEFSVFTGWDVVERNARLALKGEINPALVWSRVNSFEGHSNRALFLGGLKFANFALSPAFRPIGGKVHSWASARREEKLRAIKEESGSQPAERHVELIPGPAVAVMARRARRKVSGRKPRGRRSKGFSSEAARLLAKFLPNDATNTKHKELRSEMLLTLSAIVGKKLRSMQGIEDSQLSEVIEQTFKGLVEGIEKKRVDYSNKGHKPAEYGLLEQLDEFVRNIGKDESPIAIPFVRTKEYLGGMEKHLKGSKEWTEKTAHKPSRSRLAAQTATSHKVSRPVSAKDVADASGFVEIGAVGDMKLWIKIDELGPYVKVFVRLGTEKIGFVRFRRIGRGYDMGYQFESHSGLKKSILSNGTRINEQTKQTIANAIAESFDKAGGAETKPPGGRVPQALRDNRGARGGPGTLGGPRRERHKPFNHKPDKEDGPGGGKIDPIPAVATQPGTAATPEPSRMSAVDVIGKFASQSKHPSLHAMILTALRDIRGLPRDSIPKLESATDERFPFIAARTFKLLNDEINATEPDSKAKNHAIETLRDLFKFVDAAIAEGFELPVVDGEAYKAAKETYGDQAESGSSATGALRSAAAQRPAAHREFYSNAARLLAELLPVTRDDAGYVPLRRKLLAAFSKISHIRMRSLQKIKDDQLPGVIEETFDVLVAGIKEKKKRHNQGHKPAEYDMLKRLSEFASKIGEDVNHIAIPFADTPRYTRDMKKYLAEGETWKPPKKAVHKTGSNRPPARVVEEAVASTYKVTMPRSVDQVYKANGYVKIGFVDGAILEIKINGLDRSVHVYVRIGGFDIGFATFIRRGEGFHQRYFPAEDIRKLKPRGNPPTSKQTIVTAIYESFEKGR